MATKTKEILQAKIQDLSAKLSGLNEEASHERMYTALVTTKESQTRHVLTKEEANARRRAAPYDAAAAVAISAFLCKASS